MQIFHFIDKVIVATSLFITDSYYLNGKPDLDMHIKSVSRVWYTYYVGEYVHMYVW